MLKEEGSQWEPNSDSGLSNHGYAYRPKTSTTRSRTAPQPTCHSFTLKHDFTKSKCHAR
jgi:hypothetical protein